MTTARTRVKMRQRPIDHHKKLSLVSTNDVPVEEIHKQIIDMIPIPPIKIIPSWATERYVPWQPSKHYSKTLLLTGALTLSSNIHYDLLQEDSLWLHQYNLELKRGSHQLTEDELENLIDLFEKKSFEASVLQIDCSPDFPYQQAAVLADKILGLRGKYVEAAYKYWIKKRKALRKPLMRWFRAPPLPENPSPHVAFRPRQTGRRISSRNPRKNDENAYFKMRYLRRDFFKVLDVLDLVIKREQLKHQQALANAHLFDKKLQASDFALPYKPVLQRLAKRSEQLALKAKAAAAANTANTGPIVSPSQFILQPANEEEKVAFLLRTDLPECTYSRETSRRRRVIKNKRRRKRDRVRRTKKQAQVSISSSDEESSSTDSICTEDSDDERYYADIESHLLQERNTLDPYGFYPLDIPPPAIVDKEHPFPVKEIAFALYPDLTNVMVQAPSSSPAISTSAEGASSSTNAPSQSSTLQPTSPMNISPRSASVAATASSPASPSSSTPVVSLPTDTHIPVLNKDQNVIPSVITPAQIAPSPVQPMWKTALANQQAALAGISSSVSASTSSTSSSTSSSQSTSTSSAVDTATTANTSTAPSTSSSTSSQSSSTSIACTAGPAVAPISIPSGASALASLQASNEATSTTPANSGPVKKREASINQKRECAEPDEPPAVKRARLMKARGRFRGRYGRGGRLLIDRVLFRSNSPKFTSRRRRDAENSLTFKSQQDDDVTMVDVSVLDIKDNAPGSGDEADNDDYEAEDEGLLNDEIFGYVPESQSLFIGDGSFGFPRFNPLLTTPHNFYNPNAISTNSLNMNGLTSIPNGTNDGINIYSNSGGLGVNNLMNTYSTNSSVSPSSGVALSTTPLGSHASLAMSLSSPTGSSMLPTLGNNSLKSELI